MPAPSAAPPKSCESTRNPHGVEGCLKTATTNPTMTLLGHRRFSAATRHHLLARADHAGAGVCGRAPAGASPGVFPRPPLIARGACPTPPPDGGVRSPRRLPAGRAGVFTPRGVPWRGLPAVCSAAWWVVWGLCLWGSLPAAGACAPPAARPHLRRRWPWRVGCVAARWRGVQAAPVMCGAG